MAVVYLKSYMSFMRVLIMVDMFILIYIPFVVCFSSGYFLSNFSQNFVFYYGICGFMYIWAIITIVGIAIHWILNLTEKSKR